MTVLRLTGTVVVDDSTEMGDVWAVDGRLTFERPRHSGGEQVVEGVVLPGLVDVHCHVGVGPDGPVDAAAAERQAQADRDTGVLLIRDAGSASDTAWVRDRDDLPRLIRAGRFIARPKRYLRGFAVELDDVGQLPEAVAHQARVGDGWVKLIADWIDRDLGADADLRPLWPDDVLAEAVAAAHAEGARVTAHTFASESVDALLDAGVDCIEHGTGMTAAHMGRAAALGVPVVPTLLQVGRFEEIAAQADGKYPVFAARMRGMFGRRHRQVRDLVDAGVPLLVGTDAGGTITHGSFAEEAREMVAAGVSAAEVVASASWRARAFLGARGLEEGASADAVVYAEDPRADIGVLARPHAVVLRGELR